MAGMLPGVECARRRRFGNSTESFSGSRRSFFCLYTTSHEMHHGRTSMQRSVLSKESSHEALGTVAREARERLDAKLKTQRPNGSGSVKVREQEEQLVVKNLMDSGVQREVFCGTKSRRRWFKWSKLGWEAAEPADCAVCLEDFKAGDVLVHLLCDHRFHCDCVLPWLETSSQCPCCRTSVFCV
ncbi:RING-H2 finger protein ATL47-like isoform X1 [Zingiber officinale]|uniref:RING-H2 finger protein ATL47-like isoform X1 n=1 Tax=Zingiber officinale TaxID=94328 RepID=UPI001C4D718A|nr:RING-H2 finger protein ATL47-like isoform X1 [Zingiber officinale]